MPTRVPEKDGLFDQYIQNTNTYIAAGVPLTNGIRLGLLPDEIAEWDDFRNDWVEVYPVYSNLNQRTKTITLEKNHLKKDFTEFAQPLLDRIAASANLEAGDRVVFNIPVPDRTPTPRGAISDIPYSNIKPIGGGILEVRVRTVADANRASRHPLADGVEVKYKIAETPEETPPVAASDCPNNTTSSRALFKIAVGQPHSGKKVFCFFRWINLNNAANNGPWSAVVQTVVV